MLDSIYECTCMPGEWLQREGHETVCASYIFREIWKTFGTGDLHKNLLSDSELIENQHSESHNSLRGVNELLCIFLTFVVRFGWSLTLELMHIILLEHMWVLWKSVQGRSYFSNGCRWNYIYMYFLKQYDILKVKNILVKSVYDVMVYIVCSFIVQGEHKWSLLLIIFYCETVKWHTASRNSGIVRHLFKSLTVLYNIWASGCSVLPIYFTMIGDVGK